MFPAMSAVRPPIHMSKQRMTRGHGSSIHSWWMFDMFLPLLRTCLSCCSYMTSRRSSITDDWTTAHWFPSFIKFSYGWHIVLLTWIPLCIVNETNDLSSVLQVSIGLRDCVPLYIVNSGKHIWKHYQADLTLQACSFLNIHWKLWSMPCRKFLFKDNLHLDGLTE